MKGFRQLLIDYSEVKENCENAGSNRNKDCKGQSYIIDLPFSLEKSKNKLRNMGDWLCFTNRISFSVAKQPICRIDIECQRKINKDGTLRRAKRQDEQMMEKFIEDNNLKPWMKSGESDNEMPQGGERWKAAKIGVWGAVETSYIVMLLINFLMLIFALIKHQNTFSTNRTVQRSEPFPKAEDDAQSTERRAKTLQKSASSVEDKSRRLAKNEEKLNSCPKSGSKKDKRTGSKKDVKNEDSMKNNTKPSKEAADSAKTPKINEESSASKSSHSEPPKAKK
ncbi:hypothetical protein AB6A40_004764 [Gnathostoma spinigerum]|uniref:Uncharacterized protein n=1 Tax=Gnathostoma spinigerum TaxID=75299 RepID=A0ABD6EEL1_9BILA